MNIKKHYLNLSLFISFLLIKKRKKNIKILVIFHFLLLVTYTFDIFALINKNNSTLNDILFINNIIKEIKENDIESLLLKKTKIENIMLLIKIMPFIKKDLRIFIKNNNNNICQLFNKIFYGKQIINNTLRITQKDLKETFNDIWNYDWEIFPELEEINKVRYIINKYYNESYLNIFDKALNDHLKIYIEKKKNKFTSKEIKQLMSKLFFIY